MLFKIIGFITMQKAKDQTRGCIFQSMYQIFFILLIILISCSGSYATAKPYQLSSKEHIADRIVMSSDSKRVVYRADTESAIYSVQAGGGKVTKLSIPLPNKNMEIYDIRISQDSKFVLYAQGVGHQFYQDGNFFYEWENTGLFSVPIWGGKPAKIFEYNKGYELDSFQLSPDSATIVFTAKNAEKVDLFTVPTKGGTVTKLSENVAKDPQDREHIPYKISPDSRDVIFMYYGNDGIKSLKSVPISGGLVTTLCEHSPPEKTSDYQYDVRFGNWEISKGYNIVVYEIITSLTEMEHGDVKEGIAEMYSVPLEGGEINKLDIELTYEDLALNEPSELQFDTELYLTPDSQTIIYRTPPSLSGGSVEANTIYAIPMKNYAKSKLYTSSDGSEIDNLTINPDSKSILFIVDENEESYKNELISVLIDGSSTVVLNNNKQSGLWLDDFKIIHSSKVIFMNKAADDEEQRLYTVPLEGGPIKSIFTEEISCFDFFGETGVICGGVTDFIVSPDFRKVYYKVLKVNNRTLNYSVNSSSTNGGASKILMHGGTYDVQISNDSTTFTYIDDKGSLFGIEVMKMISKVPPVGVYMLLETEKANSSN